MKIAIRQRAQHDAFDIQALDREGRPWHRATWALFGQHALATIGGNPARAIQPIDPLWWMSFWEGGLTHIEVEAALISHPQE